LLFLDPFFRPFQPVVVLNTIRYHHCSQIDRARFSIPFD
jgi:hypothetical protein